MKNTEIIDVILFGSVAREKKNASDTDIVVLFKKKINKNKEYDIRKIIEKYFKNISILSKTKLSIKEQTFDAREGILFEGISLISGKNIAEDYGFKSFGLFKYNFNKWTKLQKTKFYHALNGRNNNIGISKSFNCIKLSDQVILVPKTKIDSFAEFLQVWNINFIYIPTLIPERMSRREILEN